MSRDASDAEDDRLLAEGRYPEVVARHYDDLLARAVVRLGRDRGHEAANAAVVRVLGELRRGKRYDVPVRVVLHTVLGWSVADAFGRPPEDRLPEDWDVEDPGAARGFEAMIDRITAEARMDGLPDGDRRVMLLRYVEGREIAEIAAELGLERNAVDQALWRGRRALGRAWLDG